LFEENRKIKDELSNHQKSCDAMQELIENLTQNKLQAANEIENLKKQIANRDVSLKQQQQQSKNDELLIENEALRRQLSRLNDDNESLLSEMQLLEASNTPKSENEEILKLNEQISALNSQYIEKCEEISSLKITIDNNSIKMNALFKENSELKTLIESNNAPADEIKVRYDKILKKLKAYREKLFEIHDQTKLIKAEKKALLKMTKEYGDYVSTWQKDIANASTRLVIQIKELNLEIKSRDEEIKRLENELANATNANSNDGEIEKLQKQISSLNDVIKFKDKQLEEEREAQKKLKQTVKKPSMLDLELEAYEKQMESINNKYEGTKKQILELESTISSQNDSIEAFKNQIALLEQNLESEKSHSSEIKKNLDEQLNILRKSEHDRTESNLQLDLMNKNYETLKLENAEVKLEMAKSIGDMEKRHQMLENERNELLKNITALENEVDRFKKIASNHEKEIDALKTEFSSYKIRAQSVLRQNQTKDIGREQELQDEVLSLRNSLEFSNESNSKLLRELEVLKKNFNELAEDKIKLQTRCKDLLATLEKQSDDVLEESRKRNQEHEESVKAYQLQIDTLNTFYKKRIQELEESKKNSIQTLQEKLDAMEKNLLAIQTIPSAIVNSNNSEQTFMGIPKTDDQKISNMLDLMDREVEGSEDTSSQPQFTSSFQTKRKISRGRDLIPLEELLNSSFDDNSNEINDDAISIYSSPSEVIEHTRTKLLKEENRVAHLTALLADSEKDLARMQQLNDMLKEEVRRHQRSIEREQHIQNSEYLKNIIIKFVTLNNGDEKQRLIPVLNTILKLSSDELQVLQNACKGGWLWNK
jgi:chromosome segregation ATPase